MSWIDAPFSALVGRTLSKVKGGEGDEEIVFTEKYGTEWHMVHDQDCCEDVRVEEISGNLDDLIDSPILQAEVATSTDFYNGKPENPESFTWTFYKLATRKGYVTIRWLGESNGYYGEDVSFYRVAKNEN